MWRSAVVLFTFLVGIPAFVLSEAPPLTSRLPVVQTIGGGGRACPLPWGVVSASHVLRLSAGLPDAPRAVLIHGVVFVERDARYHPVLDAVLFPSIPGLTPFEPSAKPLRKGLRVRAAGLGDSFEGRVEDYKLLYPWGDDGAMWIYDGSLGAGSSGSCLLDDDDRVVGITIGSRGGGGGLPDRGIAIPITYLTEEWFRGSTNLRRLQ